MNSYFVSNRYAPAIFFFIILASIVSSAEKEMIPIFGYVALESPRLPIRRKFDNLPDPSPHLVNKFKSYLELQKAESELQLLSAVNAWVNDQVKFTSDAGDQWSSANQTLSSGKGDCEDYAIAKMQLLTKIGYDQDRLFFVVLTDLVRRSDHAILVAKTGDEYLVLDNGTDRLLPESEIQDYIPHLALNAKKSWIFGKAAK